MCTLQRGLPVTRCIRPAARKPRSHFENQRLEEEGRWRSAAAQPRAWPRATSASTFRPAGRAGLSTCGTRPTSLSLSQEDGDARRPLCAADTELGPKPGVGGLVGGDAQATARQSSPRARVLTCSHRPEKVHLNNFKCLPYIHLDWINNNFRMITRIQSIYKYNQAVFKTRIWFLIYFF